MDWRESAACAETDPDLFFPVGTPGHGPYERQVAAARAVCGGCPVRSECLAWAVDGLEVGVAGGLTELERRAALVA